MEEWKTYTLDDICIGKGTYGIGASAVAYDSSKYTYLRITDINDDGTLNKSDLKSVEDNEAYKYILKKNDIVFARTGNSTGRSYFYDGTDGELVYAGFLIKFSLDPTKVNPRIMKYYTHSQEYYDWVKSFDTGGTRGNINAKTYGLMPIILPPRSIQDRIVEVLKSIDEKIELNKRINDNLEQQASSLLSDWISTYPCRTYKLSDICKYANAKCETGNLTPQNYISTENMLPNKKGIVEASNIPTGKATCFKVDDILIANIRPYFQKIWKADINGGCSADVLCIRANIESHSPILYWLLHQDAFFEYVMTGAKGCKMPRGDKQHIINWSIDLPEVQYWADLATQLGSIDQQIAYNRIESINLSNLRDTLLPKLMSGVIKINEIDC